MKSSYRNVGHLQLPINLVRTNLRIKILITRKRIWSSKKVFRQILHNRKLNTNSNKSKKLCKILKFYLNILYFVVFSPVNYQKIKNGEFYERVFPILIITTQCVSNSNIINNSPFPSTSGQSVKIFDI